MMKSKTSMSMFMSLLMLVALTLTTSCTGVKSGHKGVKVSWGGKTDTDKIYDEGLHGGFSWIFDSMIEYDVREKTMTQDYQFNDRNNMLTGVEIALDWNIDPGRVNIMHTKISDLEAKLEKSLKSAAKEVVPQYTASELNITKRNEAEEKLGAILEEELPEIYCQFARVQMTDVDIPPALSQLSEETAGPGILHL